MCILCGTLLSESQIPALVKVHFVYVQGFLLDSVAYGKIARQCGTFKGLANPPTVETLGEKVSCKLVKDLRLAEWAPILTDAEVGGEAQPALYPAEIGACILSWVAVGGGGVVGVVGVGVWVCAGGRGL